MQGSGAESRDEVFDQVRSTDSIAALPDDYPDTTWLLQDSLEAVGRLEESETFPRTTPPPDPLRNASHFLDAERILRSTTAEELADQVLGAPESPRESVSIAPEGTQDTHMLGTS